ncbi:SUMF1/EgtB/PvdO family nonheme iron enzyme [Ideonella sp. A 288]|uniref:SUMF1/EgtB/PvdO family nonheme iron enzyme n=1 Tax=Ideonella sp. A 288 TaxID=1962181 RepID=UPI003855F04F
MPWPSARSAPPKFVIRRWAIAPILGPQLRLWGPPTGARRAVRGGSWNNHSTNCRASYRNRNTPGNRNNNLGFRVVCCHIPRGRAGQCGRPWR